MRGFDKASLFPGGTLRTRHTRLLEILQNSTNQMTTSKLLKCFHFVCHMHQTFSQRFMGVMSKAETKFLQSSEWHDLSEIILICWFGAHVTFLLLLVVLLNIFVETIIQLFSGFSFSHAPFFHWTWRNALWDWLLCERYCICNAALESG